MGMHSGSRRTIAAALLFAGLLLAALPAAPAQAAGPVRIATLPLTLKYAPVWSHQQDRIAYVSADGIFVVGRNGSGLVKVHAATAGLEIGVPSFSADGRFLAFNEGAAVKCVDSRTGEPGPAYALPQGAESPVFSSDGRYLATLSRQNDILYGHLLNLKTGARRDIPNVGPVAVRFSADGNTLFFLDGSAYHAVCRLDLADPDSKPVALFNVLESAGFGNRIQAYDLAVADTFLGLLTNTPEYAYYSLYTCDLTSGTVRYQTSDVKEFDLTSAGALAYISHGDYSLERIDLQIGTYFNIDWGKVMFLRFAPQEDCLAYVKFTSTVRQLWLYVFADKTAPPVPAAPVVTASGIDWVELEIPAAAHPWFRVHVNGAPHAAVASGTGRYRVEGLPAGSDLSFRLSAIDFGWESGLSEAAAGATGSGAPAPPTAILPFDVSVESFGIRFNVSGEYEGYLVSLDGAEPVATTLREHAFTGLSGATAYRVAVRCRNGEFVSEPLEATVTTAAYPPFSPAVVWPVADGALLAACPPLAVAVSDPYLASFAATLDGAPLEPSASAGEGAHTLALHATDRGGQAFDAHVSFAIDATPPEIVFVNFADGDTVPPGFRPEVAVVDAHPATYTLLVDGVAVDPAAAALAEGARALAVEAVDEAGNAASRGAALTVALPPIALRGISLEADTVAAGTPDVALTVTFDLAGLPGSLALELLAGDVALASRTVELDGAAGSCAASLALVDAAGAPLPCGDYLVRASLADANGRTAGPLVAPLRIAGRADVEAVPLRNERALLFPHGKDADAAGASLAAQGIAYDLIARNRPFDAAADTGNYGVHVVQAKRLNAFLLDAIMPRVKAGDMLVIYEDSGKKLPGGKKNAASFGECGAGLLVRVDNLDGAAFAGALARYRALPPAEDRFGAARVVRVLFRRDGAAVPVSARVSFDGCLLETASAEPVESGAQVEIPAGGAIFRLKRANDLASARLLFTNAEGETGQHVWKALPPLADEAALLVTALDAAEIGTAAGRALQRKAALLSRGLLSLRDGDAKSLLVGRVAVFALQTALAVIEKREKRLYAEVAAPLLALDLRIRKALAAARE